MAYSYQPPEDRLKKLKRERSLEEIMEKLRKIANSKTTAMAVVVVIGLFFLYTTASAITGYVTYRENIEKRLNQTEIALLETTNKLAQAGASLEECGKSLGNCEDGLSEAEGELSSCKTEKNTCENKRDDYKNRLDTCQESLTKKQSDYNILSSDIAVKICCRPGDTTVYWRIEDNKIYCAGSESINCAEYGY